MVTALLLMLSAAQTPPGFLDPRRNGAPAQRARSAPARPAAAILAASRTGPRGRLDIDLSGLSDDDAVLASSSGTAADRSATAGHRLDPFVADLISNVSSDPPRAGRAGRPASAPAEERYPPGSW